MGELVLDLDPLDANFRVGELVGFYCPSYVKGLELGWDSWDSWDNFRSAISNFLMT